MAPELLTLKVFAAPFQEPRAKARQVVQYVSRARSHLLLSLRPPLTFEHCLVALVYVLWIL